jgi:hypothetical protein
VDQILYHTDPFRVFLAMDGRLDASSEGDNVMTVDLDTGIRLLGRDANPGRPLRRSATGLQTSGASHLRDFYSHRSSRIRVAIASVLLCYGGGAAMFWLHAIYRGEEGPAIAAPYHWLLDSTLGLVALAPAIFFLLPVAHHAIKHHRRLQPFAVGAAFALITTPGPVIHDQAVGGGTPLAQLATNVFGRDMSVATRNLHAVSHSATSECLLQLAVGLPVYMLLMQAAFSLSAVARRSFAAGNVVSGEFLGRTESVAARSANAA